MKLRKCEKCRVYTLEEICPKCKAKTKNPHYKFIHLKSIQNKKLK